MPAPPREDGLEALLDRLPPALVMMGVGAGVAACGGWLFFGAGSFLLNVLGIPVLSMGLATATLGGLKTTTARRLARLHRAEVEALVDEDAQRVCDLLGPSAGRSVQEIADALEMDRDDVVRALGNLQRAGRVDEDVDLETGTFTYRLDPDAAPREGVDPHGHRSLGDRLSEIDR